ncbi:MAG TPA: hypothetical protein VMD79_05415 [Solirubrobacteraceae bacterium]|nr:hypothetical protein [Solirubrobacteraceae bacterium]
MSGAELGLGLSVFLACAVEAVEALTIVLAVGSTRSWRSATGGAAGAAVVLAALVTALGSALTALPIDALRVAVGGLLLIFGLQWLRKAILRSAGLKAKHDELDAYEREQAAARASGVRGPGFDGYSFAIAFKGVLLEGLEVVFIVVGFGANQHRIALAAAAAGAALVLVLAAGVAIRAPLARVPENTMKLVVGVMLSSFGMFWGAEGVGAHWPAGDAALLALIPGVLLVSLALASLSAASRGPRAAAVDATPATPATPAGPAMAHAQRGEALRRGGASTRALALLGVNVWEFVVGEDWQTALAVASALAFTALLAASGTPAWWTMPAAVLVVLVRSIRRAAAGLS